jgi:two-component system sensor histidine kinase and response regulator WspE
MSEEETLAFLFLPGFSTATEVTALSGRGVGLDVVQRFAQEVGGIAAIETRLGAGTVFRFDLPVTLSVVRAVLVEIAGEPYAFPLARLERVVRLPREELRSVEGRLHLDLDGVATGLVDAAALFGLPASREAERSELASILVLAPSRAAAQAGVGERYGLLVDRLLGESDLVVRALPPRLGKVAHIAAAALSERGEPILIADVDDLVQGTTQLLGQGRLRGVRGGGTAGLPRRRVLVVDDSATVREVERQLLTRAGYEVDLAVDGVDGLNAMRSGGYDLLVSDVDMPRMNGIELVASVRREERFRTLPIVIVSYKDREEDRLAGLEAGANAYLTKGAFRDESFLRTVRDLIGDAHAGETAEPSAS